MDIKERIFSIIAQAISIDSSQLDDNTSIGDLPEWDSVGNLAIIAALEQELQIEFPLEDLFELTSVGSIIDEVKKLKHD